MKEFKSFLVLDLFTAIKGTQKNMNSLVPGPTPLVSARKMDNGYKDFVLSAQKEIFAGHCLTLNNDGDGGAGIAYYQPSGFALDTHVTALYPKRNLSRFQLLYISNCISKQKILFGHGHSINASRLEHLSCMLPVTSSGQPDYDFMEQYMKAIEKKLLTRYQSYLTQRKPNSLNTKKLNGGGKIEWKAFKMKDLMDIDACRFTGKGASAGGLVPYVGATNRNNGVMDYLRVDSSYLNDGNCIVFICNGDGSIGLSVYRETSFVGSVDVKIGRSEHLNRYTGTFMTTVADTVRPHYSFGYKRTLPRLKNESLILPVTPAGQPDYSYMEAYMKDKETKLINRYMKYRLSAER